MGVDRVLAIIGVILGVPGVIIIFASANLTLAILAVLLAALCLGAAFYFRYISNLPPYSFPEALVTLDFTKGQNNAKLTKSYKIRPNFKDLRQIEHRNIAADGQIANICWDGQPVPGHSIFQRMGEYEVRIDFPVTPLPRKVFNGTLSYDLINSFPATLEALTYCVDFPTKKAIIVVKFPPSKPCTHADLRRVNGAGEEPVGSPTIDNNGQELRIELRNPAYGANYTVYWNW